MGNELRADWSLTIVWPHLETTGSDLMMMMMSAVNILMVLVVVFSAVFSGA